MKKIVASIKKQASSEAGHSEIVGTDILETINHDMNRAAPSAFQGDGHESEITQYSSESSDSTPRTEGKSAKVVESENPRRRSTRSKRGGKKAN